MKITNRKIKQNIAGFSVLELLAVFAISGILVAITMPNLLRFVNLQRLTSSNTDVLLAMRKAQDNARRQKQVWQASFRINGNQGQWAVHRQGEIPNWQNLNVNVVIDNALTTLPQESAYGNFVRFNFNGNVDSGLGQLTLKLSDPAGDPARRCTGVDTLIGGMRAEKDEGCN